METIAGLFNLFTDTIYRVVASILIQFIWFVLVPHSAVIGTTRILRTNKISTTILLIASFLSFALCLGIPDTSRHVLSFNGGASKTLSKIPTIEAKGREYIYLVFFVVTMTVIIIMLALFTKDKLNLRKASSKRLFIDIFCVFVSYTIGWFIIIAIFFSKVIPQ